MKFEKIGTNYAKFTFEIEPEEFNQGLDLAFEKKQKEIEVKGFRKGHVPRNVYENKFGIESLYQEALNYLITQKYPKIFEEKSITIVGEPKFDVDFKKISKEKSFEINLTFPIKPEVELGEYLGAEVEKKELEVTEEELELEVSNFLAKYQTIVEKDSDIAELGDLCVFDFDGSVDGESFTGGQADNYQFKIGSNQFIPGFEEQMVGMKIGEEKDVVVTFPEDYQEKNLAGKEAVFKVKIHEIKVEKKQDLNDDFIESLELENVKTVEDFKNYHKTNILEDKENSYKDFILGSAVKFAVDNAKVDIPMEMINNEKQNMIDSIEEQAKKYGIELEMYVQFSGMTMEQFELEMGRRAQDRVLTSLVVEAISDKENPEVSQEEIEEKYLEISEIHKMPLDEVKKQLSDEMITKEIRFNKTLKILEKNVKETKKKQQNK